MVSNQLATLLASSGKYGFSTLKSRISSIRRNVNKNNSFKYELLLNLTHCVQPGLRPKAEHSTKESCLVVTVRRKKEGAYQVCLSKDRVQEHSVKENQSALRCGEVRKKAHLWSTMLTETSGAFIERHT